ncbi:MAG: hypothetical protein KIS67_13725 [Verrucomicrobiae bacterium]|nr:hypothetical protein [Verrucomicrobiae bacterium]
MKTNEGPNAAGGSRNAPDTRRRSIGKQCLLAQGYLKKEIADQFTISEETVCTHCRHIYEKLHVNCREHAVAKVMPFEALPVFEPSTTSSVISN